MPSGLHLMDSGARPRRPPSWKMDSMVSSFEPGSCGVVVSGWANIDSDSEQNSQKTNAGQSAFTLAPKVRNEATGKFISGADGAAKRRLPEGRDAGHRPCFRVLESKQVSPGPMHSDIQQLIDLQQVDSRIAALKAEVAALPAEVREIEAKLAGSKARVESGPGSDEGGRKRPPQVRIRDPGPAAEDQQVSRPIARTSRPIRNTKRC